MCGLPGREWVTKLGGRGVDKIPSELCGLPGEGMAFTRRHFEMSCKR